MFERFTDRARRVVVLAQDFARDHNHQYITPEHLMLGLLKEGQGLGYQAIFSFTADDLDLYHQIENSIPASDKPASPGHIPFTKEAKKVLELALREALQLGNDWIGTEHLFLSLIREGSISGVLDTFGFDLNRARKVIMTLSGKTPPVVEDTENKMHSWKLARVHVSAAELGTSAPWIPKVLDIEASYYKYDTSSNLIEFKDNDGVVIYAIPANLVREIVRNDAKVTERESDAKVSNPKSI